jgi:hypothetical protein
VGGGQEVPWSGAGGPGGAVASAPGNGVPQLVQKLAPSVLGRPHFVQNFMLMRTPRDNTP